MLFLQRFNYNELNSRFMERNEQLIYSNRMQKEGNKQNNKVNCPA